MASHRILAYGASNLWLSRSAFFRELRSRFVGELEIGLANGPGRSYGIRAGNPLVHYEPLSRVDFSFPGEPEGQKVAFVTDLGNDIAYSQSPEQIVNWLQNLCDRLEGESYHIVVGGIPVDSLTRLSPLLFKTVAKLYYPDGSITQEAVNQQLSELAERVEAFCLQRDYPHYPLQNDWYSFDHFHLKPAAFSKYWQSLMRDFPVLERRRLRNSPGFSRSLLPRRYWLRGMERRGQERYGDLVPDSLTFVR